MDAAVTSIASTQLGLVTRAQALAAGLTPEQVEQRASSRRWLRLQPRVYSIAGTPASWSQRVMAALLAAGPPAVASHLSAAVIWEFRSTSPDRVEITVSGRRPRLDRVLVHRVDDVPEPDRCVVGGIPVASVARTLVDLSGSWSRGQLSVALDEMLRRRATSLVAVEQCMSRLGPAPGRRRAVIGALVAERQVAFVIGESHLEQLIFQPLAEAGIDLPIPQYEVTVSGQRFRLDFAWPDAKLYVEVDGFDTHRMLTDFHRDRRRDALLVAAGWTPLHFTERSAPVEIVDRVTSVLARLRRQDTA